MTSFTPRGERELHRWQAFRLVELDIEAPSGERFQRTILRHPGAVGIVAVDGDDAILVRQFRPALGHDLLEIPAGTLDKEGELPADCARRELAEEAGAHAAQWDHLASYAVAPGVSDETLHLYLARDLTFVTPAADGIEEENMTIERFPVGALTAGVDDGRLRDAKTILGLLLARHLLGR